MLGQLVTVTPGGDKLRHNGLLYRSPVINLARDPRWGRIWEGFGEDPWLSSRMTVAYVRGMQGDDPRYLKIAGTLKHYPLNDEERDRSRVDVTVSDRMLHEYYMRPFKAGVVEAKVTSLMSSYNSINGAPAAENQRVMVDVLRKQWSFDGITVPDSGAVENIVRRYGRYKTMEEAVAKSIGVADTDLDTGAFSETVVASVRQKFLDEASVDQAVRRIMRVRFRLGEFDPPAMVPYTKIPASVIDSPEHRLLALRQARESIVLLKNENNLLPLDRSATKTVAVIGPLANMLSKGANYTGLYSSFPTNLQGIKDKLGSGARVLYARGSGVQETDDPEASLREAEAAARQADVVLLFVGANEAIEREGLDRTYLTLPTVQVQLVRRVMAANPRTVVVLQNGGPITLAGTKHYIAGHLITIDQSAEAPAVLDMFWDGEAGAAAIADVIFGDYNPGGRLPYTVYRPDANLPSMNERDITKGFTYLYYEGDPEWAFGHGLSYTSFSYSKLSLAPTQDPRQPLTLRVDVANSGPRAGDEVVQVYVRDLAASVKRPNAQLVAFQRVNLKPGERRTLSFSAPPQELAFWDESKQAWSLEAGAFEVQVGSSSKDIRLRGQIDVATPALFSDVGELLPAPTP